MSAPARSHTRDIVTPVTLVLFAVSTVTGIMLLLHWQGGLVKASHEWLSLVFSAVALWHLARNWKPFLGYLRRRLPQAALAGALAVSIGFTALTGQTGGVSPGAVFHRLADAPVSSVAPALGLETQAALIRLEAAGAKAGPDESLATVAGRAGLTTPALLGLLIQSADSI